MSNKVLVYSHNYLLIIIGVGRVTKVDSTRSTKQYDVTYILGGKEKSVDEIYISLHEPELSNNACLSVGKRIPMSAEKVSRPLRKRKTQEKKPEPSHFLQTFNDEELQHIPLDVLEWAGIAHTARPTKGKEAAKKVCSKTLSTKPSARKKRVLADANGNVTPEKSMKLTAISTKNRAKSDRPIISFQDAIESINNVELIRRADARYSSLLSMEEHSTFHAVISSLSESDTKLLTSLIKILKSRNSKALLLCNYFVSTLKCISFIYRYHHLIKSHSQNNERFQTWQDAVLLNFGDSTHFYKTEHGIHITYVESHALGIAWPTYTNASVDRVLPPKKKDNSFNKRNVYSDSTKKNSGQKW